jgi:hypothetical protein
MKASHAFMQHARARRAPDHHVPVALPIVAHLHYLPSCAGLVGLRDRQGLTPPLELAVAGGQAGAAAAMLAALGRGGSVYVRGDAAKGRAGAGGIAAGGPRRSAQMQTLLGRAWPPPDSFDPPFPSPPASWKPPPLLQKRNGGLRSLKVESLLQ